ncbi:MAG: ABC transporter permease [Clostridia bacterium]|nr:ABC transporter permease [Clostridia bacterium]
MEKIRETNKPANLKEWFNLKAKSFRKNANIVRELVNRNVKIQYRNSAIGVVWTVLQPLLNMLVMLVVFGTVLGYGDDPTYALYLFCGTITFAVMRAGTTQSMTSIVNNRGLLTKNKISQYVFPISCNLTACINFAFSLIAFFGVMFIVAFLNPEINIGTAELPNMVSSWSMFSPYLLLVLVVLPALFLFSYGLSLILATLYVFFRDVQHFYGVFLTLWTYLTPMFYKVDRFEGNIILYVIKMNPMFHYVEFFRDIAFRCPLGMESFDPWNLVIIYAFGLGAFLIGTIVFACTRRRFIYNL